MKKNDVTMSMKIPRVLKAQLEEEAEHKGITMSELVRMRMRNVQEYDGHDIPAFTLNDNTQVALGKCKRCGSIYFPKYPGQFYWCNTCGCEKGPCECQHRQRLLII